MLEKLERKPLDFTSFPSIIRDMAENNSDAAAIIDELIELKGETISLSTLILLDDINIRGIQLYDLYKMCDQDIEKFYNKIINITKDDILSLNKISAPLCFYKAIFEGTSEDRKKDPQKYIFKDEEREKYTNNKSDNTAIEKDLYPAITEKEALDIIESNGFICGYRKEYVDNNHNSEIYRVFYNDLGDILYTTSLENKDIFLWQDAKLSTLYQKDGKHINYLIELKDHPFKVYNDFLNQHNEHIQDCDLMPIIKTIKGIQYLEHYPKYTSCIIASIYDLLSFEHTYQELDDGLRKIYKPLLECASDKAYDEIIKHLNSDDGIEIANDLQNILGYNLSKTKLIAAKERFCEAHGHEVNRAKKRFLSKLFSDDPYTKDINSKIIDVLKHDVDKIAPDLF